jgi:hypothetical protein
MVPKRKQRQTDLNALKELKINVNVSMYYNKIKNERGDDMYFSLTRESMELLIESIVDAVESTENRDEQFELVKTILEDNGIMEIKD